MDSMPIIAEGSVINLGDSLNRGHHYLVLVSDAPSEFHLEAHIPHLGWRAIAGRRYPGAPGLTTELEFKVVSPVMRIVFDEKAKMDKKPCVVLIQKYRNSPN